MVIIPYEVFSKILNYIFRYTYKLAGFLATILTLFAPLANSTELPPITSDILKVAAKKLAAKIRNKEIKSADLVQAYISRINEVNPVINSVVEDRYPEALNEAKQVDQLIENAPDVEDLFIDKPLLGIPFTVKETIAVKGLSNNAARSRVSSHVAKCDAECVALLRRAGAIPLLVSNTPELCLEIETNNPIYGRTKNPYDSRRTCAGSSGGEAALLGAAASLLSIGSDIAGSVRLPAMFCGVFSHKPTPGFIPNNGHVPTSKDPMWDHYFTIAPLVRYAEDLRLMLLSMIPLRNNIERLRLNVHVDVRTIKVYYMYGEGKDSILQDEPNYYIRKAVRTAVDILDQYYNCFTTKVDLSCFKNSFAFGMFILQMKGIENVYQKNDENPDDYNAINMLEVIFKKFTFQSKASLSSVLFGPLQCLVELLPDEMKENLHKRLEYTKKKVLELLSDNGVLIYPTFPCEALFHDRSIGMIPNLSYLCLFNVLGLPVTQCHIGYTREGLPVGVQIIAAPENDRLCLAIAESLSEITGGWHPPDSIKVKDK